MKPWIVRILFFAVLVSTVLFSSLSDKQRPQQYINMFHSAIACAKDFYFIYEANIVTTKDGGQYFSRTDDVAHIGSASRGANNDWPAFKISSNLACWNNSIVFAGSSPHGPFALYGIDVTTAIITQFIQLPDKLRIDNISVVGNKIVFLQGETPVIFDPDTKTTTPLLADTIRVINGPAFPPSYTQGDPWSYVYLGTSGGWHVTVVLDAIGNLILPYDSKFPQWCAKDTMVYQQDNTINLLRINEDGDYPQIVLVGPDLFYRIYRFSCSPDGKRIAFAASKSRLVGTNTIPEPSMVYTINLDGTGLTKVSDNGSAPVWDETGKSIGFIIYNQDGSNSFTVIQLP